MQIIVNTDTDQLVTVAKFLLTLAGGTHEVTPSQEARPVVLGIDPAKGPDKTVVAVSGPDGTNTWREVPMTTGLAPADNPEAGTGSADPVRLQTVFEPRQTTEPNPAEVFGGTPLPSPAVVAAMPPAAPVPPGPPAVAPPAFSQPPSPSAVGVERDAAGLPWDGRIHTSTKAKNADGKWRQKRGINDDALIARIETELRAAAGAPAAPPPPPVPAAPPGPPGPPTASPGPFPELLMLCTAGKTAGWLDDAKINAALASLQIPALPVMSTRPDLLPTLRQMLEVHRPVGVQ